MSDFQIILDEQNEITVDSEISGDSVSTKNMKSQLIVETGDGFDLKFDGVFDEETKQITFRTPILANTLPSGEYKCSMEIILEDSRFFQPMQGTVDAVMPTRIEASIKNQKKYEEKKLKPVEIKFEKPVVEEVKEEEVEDKPVNDLIDDLKTNIQSKSDEDSILKNIENCKLEFKLAADKEFEVKNHNEIKMVDEDGSFEGYAAVFNNVDSHGDVIKSGAFSRTLNSGKKILMPWQHDMREIIGGYVEAFQDDHGLYVKGKFELNVQRGFEAYQLTKSGYIDGLSIGYSVDSYTVDRTTGIRTLTGLNLHEVSVVSIPSNPDSRITNVKSEDTDLETKDDEVTSKIAELLNIFPKA